MSVLNKTLKGLEQRQSNLDTTAEREPTVAVTPILDISEKLHKLALPLLALTALCLISYVIYKKGIIQDYFVVQAQSQTSLAPASEIATNSQEFVKSLPTEAHKELQRSENNIANDIVYTTAKAPEKPINSEAAKEKLSEEPVSKKIEESAQSNNPVVKQAEVPVSTEPAKSSMKQIAQVSAEQKANEHFQAGKKAFTFGLVSEAIVELKQCVAILAEHLECRSLLAAAYYGRKDTNAASDILEQGLSLRPSSMEWRTLLAKIYADNKQYQEVLSVLSQQFESQADNDFWILKGLAAQQLSQHAVALRSFKKLTSAEPEQGKWWLAMGRSAEHLEQWQNAMQYYTTATQIGNLSPASQRYAVERLQFIRGRLNAS